jgi:hypothetical protein
MGETNAFGEELLEGGRRGKRLRRAQGCARTGQPASNIFVAVCLALRFSDPRRVGELTQEGCLRVIGRRPVPQLGAGTLANR